MIYFLMIALVVSTVLLFCSRHFLISILSMKLMLDVIVVLMARTRGPEGQGAHFEAGGWILASVGSLFLFSLIVVATRKFASQSNLDLGDIDE